MNNKEKEVEILGLQWGNVWQFSHLRKYSVPVLQFELSYVSEVLHARHGVLLRPSLSH